MRILLFTPQRTAVALAVVLLGLGLAERGASRLAAQQPPAAPRYQVDPFWP